jgi:pantoate--beta-alanine ligase
MVQDLNWPVEIIGVPTVREPDGLALSSRNVYLDPANRRRAVVLSRALQAAHQAYCAGERRASVLEQRMREELSREPEVQVEYIAITEPDHLQTVADTDGRTVVALAARVGATRLIDNIELAQGLG